MIEKNFQALRPRRELINKLQIGEIDVFIS